MTTIPEATESAISEPISESRLPVIRGVQVQHALQGRENEMVSWSRTPTGCTAPVIR